MEQKIRQHIENLFSSAPATQQTNELKEEIIRNTIERYHDLLQEGKNETEAYNLAIAGIGDINELLVELGAPKIEEPAYSAEQLEAAKSRQTVFRAIAIGLYILCVTPVILLTEAPLSDVSPIFMFFMISVATGLLIYSGKTKYIALEPNEVIAAKIKRSALLKAIAIGLFISCPTPCIAYSGSSMEAFSVVLMFLMIAAGVVLLILSRGARPTVDKKEIKHKKTVIAKKKSTPLYRALVAVLWVMASVSFVVLTVLLPVSIASVAFSWLVFPLAAALQGLMKAIFDYKEATA